MKPISPIKSLFTLFILLALLVSFFHAPTSVRAATLQKAPNNLGLVGYWGLDEGAGTTAGDSSGNGNTGTLRNGATWTTGKKGKALSLDGTNDYSEVGNTNSLKYTGADITISAWINPASGETNGSHFISKPWNASGEYNYRFQYNSNSTLTAWLVGATSYGIGSNSTVPKNVWTHVLYTVDSSTSVKIYINGVLDNSSTHTIVSWTPTQGDLSLPLGIGTLYPYGEGWAGDTSHAFAGSIDDVRIYNRALSATDVSNLYRSGQVTRKAVSERGLVGYWPFNEGRGTTAGDASGNGNTGAITGATWTNGKRGKGLSFNGTTSNVVVTYNASMDLSGNNETVALWVKNNGSDYMVFQSSGWSRRLFGANWVLIDNSSNYYYLTTPGITNNSWHHVAYTIAGKDVVAYVDGQATASTTMTDFMRSGNGDWWLGRLCAGASCDLFYTGLIDDFRLYNRALSASEILHLYKQNETTVNANTNSRITDGLVGAWSFNGNNLNMASSTAEILDVSGNGNHGDNSGGRADAGRIGQGWNFDGADDYVAIGDTSVLDLSTQGSLSIWARPDRSMPSDDANYYYRNFISKSYGGSTATVVYSFHWHGTNSLSELRMCTSTGAAATCQTYNIGALTVGDWYNFAVTWNTAANSLIFYVNGAAVSSLTNSNAAQNSATSLYIGGCTFGCGANQNWDGQLDEARVYNRPLSAAEIKQLYNLGK